MGEGSHRRTGRALAPDGFVIEERNKHQNTTSPPPRGEKCEQCEEEIPTSLAITAQAMRLIVQSHARIAYAGAMFSALASIGGPWVVAGRHRVRASSPSVVFSAFFSSSSSSSSSLMRRSSFRHSSFSLRPSSIILSSSSSDGDATRTGRPTMTSLRTTSPSARRLRRRRCCRSCGQRPSSDR